MNVVTPVAAGLSVLISFCSQKVCVLSFISYIYKIRVGFRVFSFEVFLIEACL